MKKLILAAALLGLLVTGIAVAAKPRHPNLRDAHELVLKAIARVDDAQKANEYDMGGHAAKAKDLLTQAEAELKAAVEAANEKDKKK